MGRDDKPKRFRLVSTADIEPQDGSELLYCRVCQRRDGIKTSELIEITIAPRILDGNIVHDEDKAYICLWCLLEGEFTRVL